MGLAVLDLLWHWCRGKKERKHFVSWRSERGWTEISAFSWSTVLCTVPESSCPSVSWVQLKSLILCPINCHPVHIGIKNVLGSWDFLKVESFFFLAHSYISQYWPFIVWTLRSPESLLNHLQGQTNDIKCKVSLQWNWLFLQLISVEIYWVFTAVMKNRSCLTNVTGYFYTFPLLPDK